MAPTAGPTIEGPPNSTISSRKIDRLKVMKSELMFWFCCATNAPAMPQVTALMTKASSFKMSPQDLTLALTMVECL